MIEFFAECGSNWLTKDGPSFDRALELIETAKEIGCAGVKFQYFKADKLWHPSMKKEIEAARSRELPLEWVPMLAEATRNKGMIFGLSVFDSDGVDEVKYMVDYFKIASFEIGLFDLIEKCYLTGKRLMLSTGQSDPQEIHNILTKLPVVLDNSEPVDILHCVSKYPAQIEDCNLNVIKSNPWINGYSDHSRNITVIHSAITLGCKIIELHLDLQDQLGIETGHSWEPWVVTSLIRNSYLISKALGTDNWDEIIKQQDRKYKANPETGLRGG